jgi:Right handed beta helix region
VSYTLKGRLETRLVAVLAPLLAAAALSAVETAWWPLALAGLMIGVGVALDLLVYHQLLPYQPGWLSVPLGLLELGAIMALAIALHVGAPLGAAVAFFAFSWLLAQVVVHAALPLARLTYAESGGELGRLGSASAAACLAVLAFAGGLAWAMRPPTVHLSAGVHRGPLVLDHAQTLVGAPGAVVQGGIVVRADDVTIRNVAVRGGENGITVEDADRVTLDHVDVSRALLDGIHVRQASVTIRDCRIGRLRSRYGQGIDISFAIDRPPSAVEGCTIAGGQEGIVSHSANTMIRDNRVASTSLRAITMTEMSMGMVEDNRVRDARGVGIFCGDHSMCEIARNVVTGVRPDTASQDGSRMGFGIVSQYYAEAKLDDNHAPRIRAFAYGTIEH